jgi:hypothetical protein
MFNKFNHDEREDAPHKSFVKIQEEEFCRILDLRKNLQFSDALIKHMSHYLSLGWPLAAVSSQSRGHQFLNFQEPQETWSEKLIEASLDGVEVNVGVRTGSASGLLILEVHKQGKVLPFRREDWSSDCIAEAGVHFEQHYYELPEGWQLPASFFLEPFEIKVFGEGDLALAPPSLEPRAQSNWRWLRPPWDSAPGPPPPILKKIIKVAAPDQDACLPAPVILAWEKIYPAIAPFPVILQALMSPALSRESYYQRLLETARAQGLQDPQLLLGLLWHAPLGDAREQPQGWKYLQQLLNRGRLGEQLNATGGNSRSPVMGPQIQAPPEEPVRSIDPRPSAPMVGESLFSLASSGHPAVPSDWRSDENPSPSHKSKGPQRDNGEFGNGWQDFFRASQENLIIERRRYEAMIYELGKLQVWQEICQQERLENKRLNRKLEAQLAREVDYLRHLLKNNS